MNCSDQLELLFILIELLMFTIVDQNGKIVELTDVESQEHLERLVAQNFPYKRFRLLRDKQLFTWGDTTKPAKLLVVPKIGGILRVTAILPNGELATFDCQSDEPIETLKNKMIKSSTEFYQQYQVYQNEVLLDLNLPLLKQNYQQAPLNVTIVGLRDHQQQIKDQNAIYLLQKEIDIRSDKLKQFEEQQVLISRYLDNCVAEKEQLQSQINQLSEQIDRIRRQLMHQQQNTRRLSQDETAINEQKSQLIQGANSTLQQSTLLYIPQKKITIRSIQQLLRRNPLESLITDGYAEIDSRYYSISQLVPNSQALDEKLTKLSDLDFSKCFTLEAKGQIHTAYPLSVTFSDKAKQTDSSDQTVLFLVKSDILGLKGKVLARKLFKATEVNTDKTNACNGALGLVVAKHLLETYVKKLQEKSNSSFFSYRLPPDYQYPVIGDIYLLEQYYKYPQKEHFIVEVLEDGNVREFAALGENFSGHDQQAQFCNSFSYFSTEYTRKQVVVSNFILSGLRMYDPIVSTAIGNLDPYDCGPEEIKRVQESFKNINPYVGGFEFLEAIGITSHQKQ